ncbi:hypothetical protein [Pollutibacter soli]|uniref:hypothetical protein n=1 Tax=Pollutibacter soli TaxID=3034157 RepID=UPI003013F736
MIEVFKTGVCQQREAERLINEITDLFPGYKANFDLDDCDHILRIESISRKIETEKVISLLNKTGYEAEILDDKIIPFSHREVCPHHHAENPGNTERIANICVHLQSIHEN